MVAEWKIKYVRDLEDDIKGSRILGISDVMDIPTSALQSIRKSLKEKGFRLKVIRKKLLIKALEDLSKEDKNYEKIIELLKKNKRITIMLVLQKDSINPFLINKIFEENKSYREARPGDILEEDIVIKAGPTEFAAGPILSEFKKFNIKTKVEGGKIAIAEDAVIAKKGDKVSEDLASFLKKMNITPIPVRIKLLLAYDGRVIYTEDILSTPLEKYIDDLKLAIKKANSITIYVGYPTKYNVRILLRKGLENSLKLSIKLGFPTKQTVKEILRRAVRIGNHLKNKANL
ncbi:50S ribosomal protein L10 [Nanoarchaeota archaeon NZ13-N]|nr:MAG: 50S ribosomal protein L10 [Nanoarchaeota archaeon NZ13-N]